MNLMNTKINKRLLINLTLAGIILFAGTVFFSACSDNEELIVPSISSFTPSTGVVGTTVTITGTNFSAIPIENVVSFNGVAATITAATTTELVVSVPVGGSSGAIAVTVKNKTATSSSPFTVTGSSATGLSLTAFAPSSGAVGSTVVITGTNFSATAASNTVTFNGTAATISSSSSTQLTVTVPTGATTGKIAVVVNSVTVTATSDFTVTDTQVNACNATNTVEQIVCLADAFKATLSTTQIATLQITLNLANAKKWSNLPCGVSCRNGLAFSALTAPQLAAAKALIQAASGASADEGYSEFAQINAADDLLGVTSGNTGSYSSGNYIIAFLGAPSTTGKWQLQFGGHHYAQNITYSGGAVISATPSHQGIEPKSWTSGNTTYTPMADERDGMADMLASFTASELGSAKIAGSFTDVLMVPGNTSNTMPVTKQGIKVSSLSVDAKAKVLAAMNPWLNDLDADAAAAFMTLYSNELDNTYVCYASNSSGTSGNASSFFTANTDYVRIDGPSIWIEFICQTGVVYPTEIHYHSVMRDHSRDYIGL